MLPEWCLLTVSRDMIKCLTRVRTLAIARGLTTCLVSAAKPVFLEFVIIPDSFVVVVVRSEQMILTVGRLHASDGPDGNAMAP